MPSPNDLTPIVNAFPTDRAGVAWTLTIAILCGGGGFGVGWALGGAKVSVLEERLKSALEARSPYQVRIAEVTTENPYRVQQGDDLIQVNLMADESPVIILPSGFLKGKTVSIKDTKGNSPTREIVVRAEGGTIDGLPQWTLAGAFSSISFVWDGKSWSAF